MREKVVDKASNVKEFIEEKAGKHHFTKFQICVGLLIAALAVVGIYSLMG